MDETEGRVKKQSGREFDVRKLLFSRKKATIDDRRKMIENEDKRHKIAQQSNKAALVLKTFKPQTLFIQKGTFFGEEYVIADERVFANRDPMTMTLDRLVAKEITFKLSCKSLDGLLMSISVDEYIRLLTKEDSSLKKLRQ